MTVGGIAGYPQRAGISQKVKELRVTNRGWGAPRVGQAVSPPPLRRRRETNRKSN